MLFSVCVWVHCMEEMLSRLNRFTNLCHLLHLFFLLSVLILFLHLNCDNRNHWCELNYLWNLFEVLVPVVNALNSTRIVFLLTKQDFDYLYFSKDTQKIVKKSAFIFCHVFFSSRFYFFIVNQKNNNNVNAVAFEKGEKSMSTA